MTQDPQITLDFIDQIEVTRRMRQAGLSYATIQGTLSREQVKRYQLLRDSKYFLVRNRGGDTGERYRCAMPTHNCGGFHEYFTYMGIDRPFRGLDGALWGYAQISSDDGLARKLADWAPHLEAAHPQSVRVLGRPREPGSDLIAVAIGVLEPISQTKAETLARMINSRRPPEPFVL